MTKDEKETWLKANLPAWSEDLKDVVRGKGGAQKKSDSKNGGKGDKGDKGGMRPGMDKSGGMMDRASDDGRMSVMGMSMGGGDKSGSFQKGGMDKSGNNVKGGNSNGKSGNKGDITSRNGKKYRKRMFKKIRNSFKLPMQNLKNPATMPEEEKTALIAGIRTGIAATIGQPEDAIEITNVSAVAQVRNLMGLKQRQLQGSSQKTLQVDYSVKYSDESKSDDELVNEFMGTVNSNMASFASNIQEGVTKSYAWNGLAKQAPTPAGQPQMQSLQIESGEEEAEVDESGNFIAPGSVDLQGRGSMFPHSESTQKGDVQASSASGLQMSILSVMVMLIGGLLM